MDCMTPARFPRFHGDSFSANSRRISFGYRTEEQGPLEHAQASCQG